MFPSVLFDWPEFFHFEFISILNKADKILKCTMDVLEEKNYTDIRILGTYFGNYAI